jgi:hypothetical protein
MMDNHTFTMVREAMPIIESLGLVDFVSNFNDTTTGFVFSSRPEVNIIGNALEFQSHSGSSFACVLRNCQYFFTHMDEWAKECQNHGIPPPPIVAWNDNNTNEQNINNFNANENDNNNNNDNNNDNNNTNNNVVVDINNLNINEINGHVQVQ